MDLLYEVLVYGIDYKSLILYLNFHRDFSAWKPGF